MSKSFLIGFISFLFVGTVKAQVEVPATVPVPTFKETILQQNMPQPDVQEVPKKARTLKELFSRQKQSSNQTQTEQPPNTVEAQLETPATVPIPIFKETILQQDIPQAVVQEIPKKGSGLKGLFNKQEQQNTQVQTEQPIVNAMLPDKKLRSNVPFINLPNGTPQVDQLIQKYADGYGVPVELVRRIIKKESGGNPRSRHRNYYGLMQIAPATAQAMGFRGNAEELLDAEINLRFAVKYLRGAYLTADGNQQLAIIYYQSGYYYKAKAKGILEETGFRSGSKSPKTVY